MPVVSDFTALLSGTSWNGGATVGRGAFLTYSFEVVAQTYLGADYTAQFLGSVAALSPTERAAARTALEAWAQVSGLVLFEVPAGQGDIRFAKYDLSLAPIELRTSGGFTNYPDVFVGPVSVRATLGGGDVFLPKTITASPYVLLHEIGHALGLKHSFEDLGGTAPTLAPALDTAAQTVMSYTGVGGVDRLGPLDVQAIQHLYGGPGADGAHLASWSWDPVRYILTQTGTAGADTVLGVGTGDVMTGGSGADVLAGMNGDDSLLGGEGADRLYGDLGGDSVDGGAGDDAISGGDGTNYLRGGDGADSIVGGAGFDDINGNMGDDTCVSGGGDDWVVGGKDNDSLAGSAGQNLVYGNIGADTCDGGAGNDIVRGGQDNDVLLGAAGDDFVSGDRGDDTVTGGSGADLFHSFVGAGIDRVLDFSATQGDRVMLDAGAVFTVRQSGADTVIDLGGADQVILVGVSMSTLTSGSVFVG